MVGASILSKSSSSLIRLIWLVPLDSLYHTIVQKAYLSRNTLLKVRETKITLKEKLSRCKKKSRNFYN